MAAHGENQVGINMLSSAYTFKINTCILKYTCNDQSTICLLDNFSSKRN